MSKKHALKLLQRENEILHSTLNERDAEIQRFKDGLKELAGAHRPYFGDDLSITATHKQIRAFCQHCRTPFPCMSFNMLRRIYGTAVDYEPIVRPYETLTLNLVKGS